MVKIIWKILAFSFCIPVLTTCIDPYYPEIGGYNSLLVVEGMVADGGEQAHIRLTRTFQSIDSVPDNVEDAKVYITDENETKTNLYSSGMGNYTASQGFKGESGKVYTLHIETAEGKKYVSDPCVMHPVPEIDSVYFDRYEGIDEAGGKISNGIMIYIDTDEIDDEQTALRWEYEETWKFKLPSPILYDYISEEEIPEHSNVREYCWKNSHSGNILTGILLPGQQSLRKIPLNFINPERSDRLTVQYSILVKQYSISPREYNFWESMRQVSEGSGGIYDTQPYAVAGNIHNVDDPSDKVLGYFTVSSVREKRIFITAGDLKNMNFPEYQYPCTEHIVCPETYMTPGSFGEPPTWDEINGMFMQTGDFFFVRPIYVGQSKTLYRLVFAPKVCADCQDNDISVQPDFWIDLP